MDAMISLQCSSSESIARELNNYLRSQGISTWICVEMDGGASYREDIVVNASGSKTLIALMNVRWAESKECRYEFNIATRSNLTKGFPQIIPVITENFDFNKYPLITGVMANTNAIFFNPKAPNETWEKVVAAVKQYVEPSSPDVTTPSPTKGTPAAPATPVTPVELPQQISEWNIKHVGHWVQSLELPGNPKDAFVNNWVDGRMLLEITQQELQESLKFTGLQAKRLLRELNEAKTKQKPLAASAVASAVTRAKVAKVDIAALHSKKGFLTGIWEGHYTYDGGKKDKMTMDITMINGLIAGYGTDPVGDFLIQGTYDDANLTCKWDKAYVGQHVVYYTGKLNGKVIKGTWDIPGQWNGGFELTFKK